MEALQRLDQFAVYLDMIFFCVGFATQFGDGFTNMFVPTSALLMGGLALGRVPYIAWLKFVMPLMVKILLLACVFIVLSIHFPF